MDEEAVIIDKIKKGQEGKGTVTFEEADARVIQLLIENETLNKKAFAFKHAGKNALTCIQNGKVDPFTPKARSRLGL